MGHILLHISTTCHVKFAKLRPLLLVWCQRCAPFETCSCPKQVFFILVKSQNKFPSKNIVLWIIPKWSPKYLTKSKVFRSLFAIFFHKFTQNVSSLILTIWLPIRCHQWQPMEFKGFFYKVHSPTLTIFLKFIFLEIFSNLTSLLKIINILSCVRLRKDACLFLENGLALFVLLG